MKTLKHKISLCLLAVVLSMSVFAQTEGVSIKTSASAPHPSAMLDIESTTKGLLIPRVTLSTSVTVLSPGITPTISLLVYNTNNTTASGLNGSGFYFWNGSFWKQISTGPELWTKIGSTNHIQYTAANVAIGTVVPSSTMSALEVNTTNNHAFRFTSPQAELYMDNNNTYNGLLSNIVQKSGLDGVSNRLGMRYSQTRFDSRGLELSTSILSATNTTGGYVTIEGNNNEMYISSQKNIVFMPYGISILSSPTPSLHYSSFDPTDAHLVYSSDSVLKTNIANLSPVLSKVMSLRPVTYNWKNQLASRKSIGVIAQETALVFPELVSESTIGNPNAPDEPKRTLKSVDYAAFAPILIKAIQEQQEQIETLKARIVALENK